MKHKISNGIIGLVRPPPDVVVGQNGKARFDFREIFLQEFIAAAGDEILLDRILVIGYCNHKAFDNATLKR